LHPEPHVIYLERQDAVHPGFHVVQVGAINANSASWSLTYKVYDPGTHVYRVRIPGGPDNEGVVSQTFTITVTPVPASVLRPEAPGNSPLPAIGSERGGETPETGAEDEGSTGAGAGSHGAGATGSPGTGETGAPGTGGPGGQGKGQGKGKEGQSTEGEHPGHHGRR
jgi:hypothetical protein